MKLCVVTLYDKINKNVDDHLVRVDDGKHGAVEMPSYCTWLDEGRTVDDYIVVNVSALKEQ